MSIRQLIRERIAEGRLFELAPSMPGDPHERTMIVSEEINALLTGPWDNQKWANRSYRLKSNLDEFMKGEILTVCLVPYEHGTAYMGRLDRPIDEVWDIRSRDPKPGLRVFGRFSEKNTFIALHWACRKELADRRDWGFARAETKRRWNKLLAPHETPFRGEEHVDAYLTDATAV